MGALTIKPLAFKARSWELTNVEIINFMESYCGKIAIQKRGTEIIRILPTRKDSYYWINDEIRFFFESLKKQRISYPYLLLNQKYIKINWQTSILFIKYIKNLTEIIDKINQIEDQLKIKKLKIIKNIFVNKNQKDGDLISNYLIKEILNLKNLIKYTNNNYKGNPNHNFYQENLLSIIKTTKYNILNNINIINDYPRIWSIIKNNKLFIIGNKKNFKLFTYTVNNTNKELLNIEKNKTLLGLFKKNVLYFTEDSINNNNYQQIILNKNPSILNNKWYNNKIDNYNIRKDLLNWNFLNTEKSSIKNLGINLSFYSHGIENNQGYHIIFPITTFLEEYSLRYNPYGIIEKSIPIAIRNINIRTLVQILYLIKIIFNNEIIKESAIQLKVLKDLLILKYGIILEENKQLGEYLNQPKIRNNNKTIKNAIQKEVLVKNSEIIEIKNSFLKKKNNY